VRLKKSETLSTLAFEWVSDYLIRSGTKAFDTPGTGVMFCRMKLFLTVAFLVLTGCTAADKDYVRNHVATLQRPPATADTPSIVRLPKGDDLGENLANDPLISSRAQESLPSR
jgi:hypothetical protein